MTFFKVIKKKSSRIFKKKIKKIYLQDMMIINQKKNLMPTPLKKKSSRRDYFLVASLRPSSKKDKTKIDVSTKKKRLGCQSRKSLTNNQAQAKKNRWLVEPVSLNQYNKQLGASKKKNKWLEIMTEIIDGNHDGNHDGNQ